MSAETSKQVRAALKAAGFGTADVSVRSHSYSMGSTVRVTVKRAVVALDKVAAVAQAFERVSRDASGEILCGGNTHVSIDYEHGLFEGYASCVSEMLEGGVRRFGSLQLNEDSRPFTWQVFDAESGFFVSQINRDSGSTAPQLARLLARRGELQSVCY